MGGTQHAFQCSAFKYSVMQQNKIQSNTAQFTSKQYSAEMTLGGTQEVPGQSVVTPVMPSGAIAQHVFCIFCYLSLICVFDLIFDWMRGHCTACILYFCASFNIFFMPDFCSGSQLDTKCFAKCKKRSGDAALGILVTDVIVTLTMTKGGNQCQWKFCCSKRATTSSIKASQIRAIKESWSHTLLWMQSLENLKGIYKDAFQKVHSKYSSLLYRSDQSKYALLSENFNHRLYILWHQQRQKDVPM